MPFQIWNRRYTGSKYKLSNWISQLIQKNCTGLSFCDLFAGTATVSYTMLDYFDKVYINDFLFSNEIIYRAFFEQKSYNTKKLESIKEYFNTLDLSKIRDNYISKSYGKKFFSEDDARLIGYIRGYIEKLRVNEKEKNILIASLLYSLDKSANTVGHYDAYIIKNQISNTFRFDLISPYKYSGKKIFITRQDANIFAKKLKCDVVYIDPPYNSRQYSRFYHVLENVAKWEKPRLYGKACKPLPENMSEYCRNNAQHAFEDLINSLNCKYIVVSYNNTYNSKSSSSKNKIALSAIKKILLKRGQVLVFEKPFKFFNAGKTSLANHKEIVFITKVCN